MRPFRHSGTQDPAACLQGLFDSNGPLSFIKSDDTTLVRLVLYEASTITAEVTSCQTGHSRQQDPDRTAPPSKPDACRDFMEQMPFGVLTVRSDFTVDYLNERFREMFGYEIRDIPDLRSWFEKFVQRPVSNSMIEQFFNAAARRTGGMHRETVIAVQTKRGGRRLCQVHFVALADGRLLTTYENLAERSRIESDMQYTKIDSVSILTSGLALIVNGMVEGLQGLLDTMQGQDSPPSGSFRPSSRRRAPAGSSCCRIQSFTGGRTKEAKPVDLNEILRKHLHHICQHQGRERCDGSSKKDSGPSRSTGSSSRRCSSTFTFTCSRCPGGRRIPYRSRKRAPVRAGINPLSAQTGAVRKR